MAPSCKSGAGETLLAFCLDGLVAEWLRRGLQILVRGFDSLRGLHAPASLALKLAKLLQGATAARPARGALATRWP
jgi:hypothetical protein